MPRKIAFWVLLIFLVLPGGAGVVVFGHYATVDWAALQATYQHYERVVNAPADFQTIFVAEADQNIHRINLFADGVWTLLCALIAAIGLHGLCQPGAAKANQL